MDASNSREMLATVANTVGLKISLLGPFDVQVNGQSLGRRHSRKENWLLALLALRNGKEVSREWLAGTLWPDTLETQALSYVRQNTYLVKRGLGSEAGRLQSPTSRTLLLDLDGADVDLIAFDRAVQNGTTEALEQAVWLYRGPLLEGCDEDWILPERQAREQSYLNCLEILAERAMERDDPASALPFLRKLVKQDPLRESAHRTLMQALVDDGNLGAMSRAYRDLRLILHQEVNSEPDPQTVSHYERLRTAKPKKTDRHEARAKSHVGGGAARDNSAGSRDREGQAQSRPAATVCTPLSASLIPTPITALVGRKELVREVIGSLSRARLVTLTGTGGVGKTRVAIDVCLGYADSVWYIELAPVREAMHVALAVAKGLGIAEQKELPPEESISRRIGSRSGLLVLDNCEHLIESTSKLCTQLLQSCPNLRILTTSRQILGVVGETALPVPALETPPSPLRAHIISDADEYLADILMEYDSVRLFVERASAVSAGFTLTAGNGHLVAQICRRLDGIPLALELTAARINVLSIRDIVKRLDDRFNLLNRGNRSGLPHHQTLRASVDWSYNLLSKSEQLLLNRVAVFAGGWSLEAAEQIVANVPSKADSAHLQAENQIVAPPIAANDSAKVEAPDGVGTSKSRPMSSESSQVQPDVLDLLSALVDRSLVVAQTNEHAIRYHLLETIREYAAEKLRAGDEWKSVHERHYAYFLEVMVASKPELWGQGQQEAVRRLEQEHDNMRVALRWSVEESDDPAQALLLSAELNNFWLPQGYFSEARTWLSRALERVDKHNRTEPRAYALQQAGVMAFVQGDLGQAIDRIEEAVSIRRENNSRQAMANSLLCLGLALRHKAEFVRAAECTEECLQIYRDANDHNNTANALNNLGLLYHQLDDFARAAECLEESLSLYRQFANRVKMATPMTNLANIAYAQGDLEKARLLHAEVLSIHEEHNNRPGITNARCCLGQVVGALGDFKAAEELMLQGLRGWLELGSKREIIEVIESLASLSLSVARENSAEALVLACRAAKLCGAAARLRESLLLPQDHREVTLDHERMANLQQALPQETLAAYWKLGQAMSLDEAASYALGSSLVETGGN